MSQAFYSFLGVLDKTKKEIEKKFEKIIYL